ncbi:alpha/beta-hydrolase [Panus rudis PR-1116 ss-1]|nr:alpha/beta-hydrolase [Panus rudis PR-1116 ss-1]
MPKVAPYGTWKSPITSDSLVESSVGVENIIVDPITSTIYHIEKRPSEGGRSVLVKSEEGVDVVEKGWNVRTGVHEMGGAAATVYDGTAYFSNFGDNRVYKLKEGGKPEAITPEKKEHRFADFAVHPQDKRLIVSILEDHTKPDPADVVNTLAVIDSQTQSVSVLLSGADFYAAPTFSPDGSYFAWQQWSHPDMPWEGGEIHVAKVAIDQSGSKLTLTGAIHVAGKRNAISAADPIWLTNDTLLFTSDESGYQNPYTYTVSMGKVAPVLSEPVPEDFSLPGWSLGVRYGAALDKEGKTILFTAVREGRSHLYVLTRHSGAIEEITCPFVTVRDIVRVTDDNVVFVGAKADEPASIVLASIKDYALPRFSPIKALSAAAAFPRELFSKPQPIQLLVPPNGDPLYVVYYPPTNPDYVEPDGEKPPCVVSAHGGPTSCTDQSLSLTKQFYTSRGWAWLDVNYSGSSGYGRKYIERLAGQWGIADARDAALAAQTLSRPPHNLIDPTRIAIRGQSAGGYTVLTSLCSYPDVFTVGTSFFGISDLKKLEEFTHKFESHYMEKLLGGTVKEIPDEYDRRSPVHNADKIKAPLLIQQGSLDAIVPPNQAEAIVKTIREKGGRIEYIVFEGEGHGWRKAENIKKSIEEELSFYEDVFKLKSDA